jgi:hypothetical protein
MNKKGSISVLIVVLKRLRLKMTASNAVGRSENSYAQDAKSRKPSKTVITVLFASIR